MMTNFRTLSPGGYEDVMDDLAKNLAANGPYDGLPGGPVVLRFPLVTENPCICNQEPDSTSEPTDQRHEQY